jgi:tetratricopeptide (TPR) repeat protein
VTPEALVGDTFIPDRHGSLQAELTAAGRRRGFVMYQIRPELTDLLRQLEAGRPVMILQNQGIRSLAVWHYAVVIGAEIENDRLISRSGTTRRARESTRTFLRRWQASDNWGIVALNPGDLPADPDWNVYLRAVADLESAGGLQDAERSYAAALEADPALAAAELGLANVYHRRGKLIEAMQHYQAISDDEQLGVAALNNLANLLLELGCPEQAEAALLKITPDETRHRRDVADTRSRLAARSSKPQSHCRLP